MLRRGGSRSKDRPHQLLLHHLGARGAACDFFCNWGCSCCRTEAAKAPHCHAAPPRPSPAPRPTRPAALPSPTPRAARPSAGQCWRASWMARWAGGRPASSCMTPGGACAFTLCVSHTLWHRHSMGQLSRGRTASRQASGWQLGRPPVPAVEPALADTGALAPPAGPPVMAAVEALGPAEAGAPLPTGLPVAPGAAPVAAPAAEPPTASQQPSSEPASAPFLLPASLVSLCTGSRAGAKGAPPPRPPDPGHKQVVAIAVEVSGRMMHGLGGHAWVCCSASRCVGLLALPLNGTAANPARTSPGPCRCCETRAAMRAWAMQRCAASCLLGEL